MEMPTEETSYPSVTHLQSRFRRTVAQQGWLGRFFDHVVKEDMGLSFHRYKEASWWDMRTVIPKLWSNLVNYDDSSEAITGLFDEVREGRRELVELETRIADYEKSQQNGVNALANTASGVAVTGIYLAGAYGVPFTGGGSLTASYAISTSVGAGVKALLKGSDDVDYTGGDLAYDLATGGAIGLTAPLAFETFSLGHQLGQSLFRLPFAQTATGGSVAGFSAGAALGGIKAGAYTLHQDGNAFEAIRNGSKGALFSGAAGAVAGGSAGLFMAGQLSATAAESYRRSLQGSVQTVSY